MDGLVFRGERLVIPVSMRPEIKRDVHVGHNGITGCLRRARESVFWPGMTSEIKIYIETCEICREGEINSQPKETLMPHEAPERPWQTVGIDLMTCRNKEYLITVDYLTNYWEIDYLSETSAKTCIKKIKSHFARYGIPDLVITDSGSQFLSDEFSRFSKEWGFEHRPTSPYHHQSNGKVESSVKAAKKVLKRTKDQYLGLLAVRNTPTEGTDSSPAQKFLGRRTKSTLPISSNLLKPRVVDPNMDNLQLKYKQMTQKRYYDRSAHDLKLLHEGDTVRIKPYKLGESNKTWKKAEVQERLDERSYKVATPDGATYRRNRVDLRKEPAIQQPPIAEEPQDTAVPMDTETQTPDTPKIRRSTRIVKAPTKYEDFVMIKKFLCLDITILHRLYIVVGTTCTVWDVEVFLLVCSSH
jgi:transposase InsO family protein